MEHDILVHEKQFFSAAFCVIRLISNPRSRPSSKKSANPDARSAGAM
nr:hypothetical protein [Eggerthella sinensis]